LTGVATRGRPIAARVSEPVPWDGLGRVELPVNRARRAVALLSLVRSALSNGRAGVEPSTLALADIRRPIRRMRPGIPDVGHLPFLSAQYRSARHRFLIEESHRKPRPKHRFWLRFPPWQPGNPRLATRGGNPEKMSGTSGLRGLGPPHTAPVRVEPRPGRAIINMDEAGLLTEHPSCGSVGTRSMRFQDRPRGSSSNKRDRRRPVPYPTPRPPQAPPALVPRWLGWYAGGGGAVRR
jgi:hypothetical protein